MKARHCCESASCAANETIAVPVDARAPGRRTLARRCLGIGEWIAPSMILALLPKCPACFAAYVAIGTGLGISLPVATFLRTLLLIACLAALTYLAARLVFRPHWFRQS